MMLENWPEGVPQHDQSGGYSARNERFTKPLAMNSENQNHRCKYPHHDQPSLSAKRATDRSTEPLLKLPDSTVVKALDIAGRSI